MTNAEQIYLQYHDKVRAYVRRKIQDPHDVEDLVSAVFMSNRSIIPRYRKAVVPGAVTFFAPIRTLS